MATIRSGALMLVLALTLAGCATDITGAHPSATSRASRGARSGSRASSAGTGPGRSGSAVSGSNAAAVAVIRGWATALAHGEIAAAARYFALPSVFVNSVDAAGQPVGVKVTSEREARLVNESLSCGAQLVRTARHGRYITATFTLVNRTGPGAGCGSGTGQPAATDFLIAHGRIVEWIRAPAGGGIPQVPTPQGPPATPAPNPANPGESV